MAEPKEVDLEDALGQLSAAQLAKLEFVINGDESVTYIDFPPELMDIAYALNPDDPLVCERMALAGEGSPDDAPASGPERLDKS